KRADGLEGAVALTQQLGPGAGLGFADEGEIGLAVAVEVPRRRVIPGEGLRQRRLKRAVAFTPEHADAVPVDRQDVRLLVAVDGRHHHGGWGRAGTEGRGRAEDGGDGAVLQRLQPGPEAAGRGGRGTPVTAPGGRPFGLRFWLADAASHG